MVTRKNKYFTKRSKSIKKESQLYPDEKGGLSNKWKSWSQLQSADQMLPDAPFANGKRMFSYPKEPTERLNWVRRVYQPEAQTNAFMYETSPFAESYPMTMNSLPYYNKSQKEINRIVSQMEQNRKNKELEEQTKQKLGDNTYQIFDSMRRPYKSANAVNESSQFYQNMFNPNGYDTRNYFQQKVNIPTKEDAQRRQYAWNYNNPFNMYSRLDSNLTKFVINQLINLGYGSRFFRHYPNPKDVIPADKVKPKTIFDI